MFRGKDIELDPLRWPGLLLISLLLWSCSGDTPSRVNVEVSLGQCAASCSETHYAVSVLRERDGGRRCTLYTSTTDRPQLLSPALRLVEGEQVFVGVALTCTSARDGGPAKDAAPLLDATPPPDLNPVPDTVAKPSKECCTMVEICLQKRNPAAYECSQAKKICDPPVTAPFTAFKAYLDKHCPPSGLDAATISAPLPTCTLCYGLAPFRVGAAAAHVTLAPAPDCVVPDLVQPSCF